jgi:hypothetical protein
VLKLSPRVRSTLVQRSTAEQRTEANAAFDELRGYPDGLMAERARAPRDDVISGMAATQRGENGLSDDEFWSISIQLWVAYGVPVGAVDFGIAAILRFPTSSATCGTRTARTRSSRNCCVGSRRPRPG